METWIVVWNHDTKSKIDLFIQNGYADFSLLFSCFFISTHLIHRLSNHFLAKKDYKSPI